MRWGVAVRGAIGADNGAVKQQDVSSTRNALRLAAQAEETGRDTLSRLGAQGESECFTLPWCWGWS